MTSGAADRRAAGGAVVLRPARPDDLPALLELVARCSPETLFRRFHAVVRSPPLGHLREAAAGATHHDARVVVADGELVALASLVGAVPAHGELAVLVEDGWQRRGIGMRLAHDLLVRACGRGVRRVDCHVLADNLAALAFCQAVGATIPPIRSAAVTAQIALAAPARPFAERTR
jgi:ribosomal protein S18 acetylase RimI-like enzyme